MKLKVEKVTSSSTIFQRFISTIKKFLNDKNEVVYFILLLLFSSISIVCLFVFNVSREWTRNLAHSRQPFHH